MLYSLYNKLCAYIILKFLRKVQKNFCLFCEGPIYFFRNVMMSNPQTSFPVMQILYLMKINFRCLYKINDNQFMIYSLRFIH